MIETPKSDSSLDTRSEAEQTAAEALIRNTIRPRLSVKIDPVEPRRPIESIRLAEVIPLARRAAETTIAIENQEHNKEERRAV